MDLISECNIQKKKYKHPKTLLKFHYGRDGGYKHTRVSVSVEVKGHLWKLFLSFHCGFCALNSSCKTCTASCFMHVGI